MRALGFREQSRVGTGWLTGWGHGPGVAEVNNKGCGGTLELPLRFSINLNLS